MTTMTWDLADRPVEAGTATAAVGLVRYAFYIFVASIPFEMPQRTLPIEIPALTGSLFLAATLLAPSACYRRIPAVAAWFGVYLWAFAASVAMHMLEQRMLALRLFVNLAQLVLILWAGANLLAHPRVWRGTVIAFLLACGARAAVQLLGVDATTQVQWTGGARISAFGQNANLAAMILSVGLIVAVGAGSGDDRDLRRLRWIAWPLAALMGAAIIQTGSRGGLLGAVAGLLAFLLRGRTAWPTVRNAVVAVAAVGLLAWGATRSEMMHNRILAAEEGGLAGREQIYPALLDMFSERPVLGWGPIDNQFELALRLGEKGRDRRDAHNLVLELLTSVGVGGAVPFLVAVALCLRHAWRSRRGPRGLLPLAMLFTVLTTTVSGTWIAGRIVWLAFTVATAAGSLVPRPARGGPDGSVWRCAA